MGFPEVLNVIKTFGAYLIAVFAFTSQTKIGSCENRWNYLPSYVILPQLYPKRLFYQIKKPWVSFLVISLILYRRNDIYSSFLV